MSEIKCPQCASDNMQRVEVAYLQGSSNIQSMSNTVGAGIGRGGIAVGGAKTSTTGASQSLLAESLSPPVKAGWWAPILMVSIGIFLIVTIAFALFGLVIFAGGLVLAWQVHKKNKNYPNALEVWRRNWICLRCGGVFTLRNQLTQFPVQ